MKQQFLAIVVARIRAWRGVRRAGLLYAPRRNCRLQARPNLEVVQNNCTACHSADYNQHPAARRKIQEEFGRPK